MNKPTGRDAPGMEPMARPMEDCMQMLFPTAIAVHDWPDSKALNADLAALVRDAAREDGGVSRSNVGGWHSGPDFLLRQEEPLQRLRGRVQRMTGEMTRAIMKPERYRFHVEGWANLLSAGQYNSLHVHPNSTWSGVYYVTGNPPPEPGGPGEAAFSGKLELVDPRPGAAATYTVENAMQRRHLVNPGAGAMVVFPSWLQHQVHPYFGPGERISIAFNVLVTS